MFSSQILVNFEPKFKELLNSNSSNLQTKFQITTSNTNQISLFITSNIKQVNWKGIPVMDADLGSPSAVTGGPRGGSGGPASGSRPCSSRRSRSCPCSRPVRRLGGREWRAGDRCRALLDGGGHGAAGSASTISSRGSVGKARSATSSGSSGSMAAARAHLAHGEGVARGEEKKIWVRSNRTW
jgi:hypothetical protein